MSRMFGINQEVLPEMIGTMPLNVRYCSRPAEFIGTVRKLLACSSLIIRFFSALCTTTAGPSPSVSSKSNWEPVASMAHKIWANPRKYMMSLSTRNPDLINISQEYQKATEETRPSLYGSAHTESKASYTL